MKIIYVPTILKIASQWWFIAIVQCAMCNEKMEISYSRMNKP